MQNKCLGILIFVLLVVLLTPKRGFGQEEKIKRINISYMPQYMFIYGQRLDIDVRVGKTNSWIVLGGHYYLNYSYQSQENLDNGFEDDAAYDKLRGYAFNLEHRIYLVNDVLPDNIYFAYGIYYGHFDITYGVYAWGNYDYSGDLDAFTYGIFDQKTTINKFGPNLTVGYRQDIIDNFFVEFLAGVALRYSFITPDIEGQRTYSDNLFQYGFTGTSPLFGIRIGKSF